MGNILSLMGSMLGLMGNSWLDGKYVGFDGKQLT